MEARLMHDQRMIEDLVRMMEPKSILGGLGVLHNQKCPTGIRDLSSPRDDDLGVRGAEIA